MKDVITKQHVKKQTPRYSFEYLSDIAEGMNIVLEKKSKGYSLYSNVSFVEADCADLNEVADTLFNDDLNNVLAD